MLLPAPLLVLPYCYLSRFIRSLSQVSPISSLTYPCADPLYRATTLQILISDICSRLNVDGLRGDIVVNRAAKALVAFEGRTEVKEADIERVISLCLNHRCVP